MVEWWWGPQRNELLNMILHRSVINKNNNNNNNEIRWRIAEAKWPCRLRAPAVGAVVGRLLLQDIPSFFGSGDPDL